MISEELQKAIEEWKEERDNLMRTYTKVIASLGVLSSGLSELNTNLQDTTLLLQDHVDFIKEEAKKMYGVRGGVQ